MARSVTPLNSSIKRCHTPKTITVHFSTNADDQALYQALKASAERADRRPLANQVQYLLRVAHGLRPVIRGREMADLGLEWPQTLDQRVSKLESDITETAQVPSPPKDWSLASLGASSERTVTYGCPPRSRVD